MHRVWILDCRSCAAFLTNRGMKAVLLLRPNVPLYSTDALPVNCAAWADSPPTAAKTLPDPDPPRSCECLTQTLCCTSCGAAVGYMIVVPCTRCTSSVLPSSHASTAGRSTNGHRFVFHASEIVAEERLYVAGEPGVIVDAGVDHPVPPPPSLARQFSPEHAPYYASYTPDPPSTAASVYDHRLSLDTYPRPPILPPYPASYLSDSSLLASSTPPVPPRVLTPASPPSPPSDDGRSSPSALARQRDNNIFDGYAPRGPHPDSSETPPPRAQLPLLVQTSNALFAHARETAERARRLLLIEQQHHHRPPYGFYTSPQIPDERALSPPPPLQHAPPIAILPPVAQAPATARRPAALKDGDVLHWHQLVRRGELPSVRDSDRARRSRRALTEALLPYRGSGARLAVAMAR